MSTLTVNVENIEGFVDVINTTFGHGGPRYTSATFTGDIMTTAENFKRVRVTEASTIKFVFPANSIYAPVGIAFIQYRGGQGDANGQLNMPRENAVIRKDGNVCSITIHNKHEKKGAKHGNEYVYKALIIIHDDHGSVGIIDPEISNESVL